MWLCDLEKAIKEIRHFYPECVLDGILSKGKYIVFSFSDFSRIYWSADEIIELTSDEHKIYLKGQDPTDFYHKSIDKSLKV